MSRYKELAEYIDEMNRITLSSLSEYHEALLKEKFAILDAMEADLKRFKETSALTCTIGKPIDDQKEPTECSTEPKKRGRTKQRTNTNRSGSLKENSERYPKRSRATGQRQAFLEASQVINNNITANVTMQTVVVKMEKLSEEFLNKLPELPDIPIKQEKTDMPPPTTRPLRQTRKRKDTRNTNASTDTESVQVKEELIEKEIKKRKQTVSKSASSDKSALISRDSDVQITPEPVDTVNLVETDEDDLANAVKPRGRPKTKRKLQKKGSNSSSAEPNSEVEQPQTARVTRTKARNAAKNKEGEVSEEAASDQQNGSSTETEEKMEKKASKRTKAKKGKTNKKVEENSIYEDAVSETENSKTITAEQTVSNTVTLTEKVIEPQGSQLMNETVVITKSTALNATVVIEKSKKPVLMNETMVINKMPSKGGSNVMDELMTDDEDIIVSPVRVHKQNNVKQVFSPYANSPVKKRVEAFEKLGAAETNSDMPPRMTRTKTKAKQQENGHSENESPVDTIPNSRKLGAIPKLKHTPLAEYRAKLKVSQSTSNSALKLTQAEFRERELRRKQKEEEALSKKEALIQAQTEERRRRREEKQLKAQQAREALERDRQEAQKNAELMKQTKINQLKAEKEEKLLKQRLEAERKRALIKEKAAEEKQREQEKKRLEEAKNHHKTVRNKVPPYLEHETPLLPTEDCYDSDDSNASKPFVTPEWQKKQHLLKILKCMRYTDSRKRCFYNNRPETVDLREIFPSIEAHKLKRTSSAIWNKSGLAALPSMTEEDE